MKKTSSCAKISSHEHIYHEGTLNLSGRLKPCFHLPHGRVTELKISLNSSLTSQISKNKVFASHILNAVALFCFHSPRDRAFQLKFLKIKLISRSRDDFHSPRDIFFFIISKSHSQQIFLEITHLAHFLVSNWFAIYILTLRPKISFGS